MTKRNNCQYAEILLYAKGQGRRKNPYAGKRIAVDICLEKSTAAPLYLTALTPLENETILLGKNTDVIIEFNLHDEVMKLLEDKNQFYLYEGNNCVGEGRLVRETNQALGPADLYQSEP